MFDCLGGRAKCVQVLVDNEANLDSSNYQGMTALMLAARDNHMGCLMVLINSNASLNNEKKDTCGNTAKMYCAHDGYEQSLQVLTEAGVQVDGNNIKGRTALMFTPEQGRAECVKVLINCAAILDKTNSNERTSTLLADSGGHLDCLLAHAGCDMNCADKE